MAAILFLDVDGVLNCEASWTLDMLDVDCCRRLLAMLDRTGAKIVLSSSWRGMPGLEERLAKYGVMAYVIGRTPRLGGPDRVRGDEIADWLRHHPAELGENGRWAIVDDDSDMLPEQMPRFVQTNFMDGGLQDDHCNRLAALLTEHTTNYNEPADDGTSGFSFAKGMLDKLPQNETFTRDEVFNIIRASVNAYEDIAAEVLVFRLQQERERIAAWLRNQPTMNAVRRRTLARAARAIECGILSFEHEEPTP